MKTPRSLRGVAAFAAAAALAATVSGCGSSSDSAAPGSTSAAGSSSAAPVELTVTTFGTFGYDELYKKYEAEHPGVTIKATNIDTGGNARTDAFTKIAAGSGLSDIVAVEEGWLGSIMEVSDQFVDLRDFGAEDIKSNWLDWKYAQGTDANGRVIGYGSDIGPTGLCYNTKLFKEAGLPTDREEVAKLFGGADATWDKYFEVGAEYSKKTGKGWYDQSGFVWNAMVNQLSEGYYKADGTLNVADNAELKTRFEQLAAATLSGQSAGQTQWDWGKGKAFVDGSFATFTCPGWMLGVVKGQVEAGGGDASTGWDFADVFPGGATNWGGSFLSVPTTSKHQKEAAELAAWLTAPEQQVAQSGAAGTFPSTVKAAEEIASKATPNEFFNNAPTGAILAKRAEGVKAQFKGPQDSVIQENVFGPALVQLDRKKTDAKGAWDQALKLLDELVVNN